MVINFTGKKKWTNRRRAGSKVNREEEFLEESITEEEENLIGSSLEGRKIGGISEAHVNRTETRFQ